MVRYRDQRFLTQQFQPLGVVIKHLPGRRQFDGLARTVEQPIAILLLQLAYLGADRRLRSENLLSSARKTALFGDFQKRNELIEIHRLCGRIITDRASFREN